jgi:hypothetical protein
VSPIIEVIIRIDQPTTHLNAGPRGRHGMARQDKQMAAQDLAAVAYGPRNGFDAA